MKVIKFGGSSLASAEQINKVLDIIKQDNSRRIVIVSAPGKRHDNDTKVTDALIEYYNSYITDQSLIEHQNWLIKRYEDIISELKLSQSLLNDISESIRGLSELPKENNPYLFDHFLASGENNNAKLIASFLQKNGLKAKYLHPKDAGIIVKGSSCNAQLLSSSYSKINKIKNETTIQVIPGFFGVTEDDNICTFSRGGSDITGSIVAAGIHADLYENFTDVDGIFVAHPGIVKKPQSIEELSYKEMRELAYAGFSVLHDEALIPAYRGKIPIVIKNTNNPKHPGTKIILEHQNKNLPVVGIASDDKFISINLSKYLMNREVGFGRKVLQILEDLNIRWEHMPTGIDDMSIVIRERELTPIKEREIINRLNRELEVDEVDIIRNLSIIMIVGENMKSHVGVTSKATKAFSDKNINIAMISQGASEVSVLFIINKSEEKKAIQALYDTFFNIKKH
ncbi:aspartate kinase [Streptococcus urinalis FB127-CNA-2]|uniref:Aspartokinase n=1 Tax=Streptococcus urinalis 2285-97 TaxID=764291 RepID=G5KDA2_9STRE|nr:aspartate kinase [Streptococcus urinalis]EHJ56217.1 aspartate kinase [Streptococcus urinalis 2285-97]EKS17057.1 aspartate kinase [Streptococcus urinalis FB127-CNA-2]VEF32693.1 aspartate kinase [Streptococcus urinalis]